jgi:hypothetical protein
MPTNSQYTDRQQAYHVTGHEFVSNFICISHIDSSLITKQISVDIAHQQMERPLNRAVPNSDFCYSAEYEYLA